MIFARYTYKQKMQGLTLCLVLFLLLSYHLSIKQTIKEYQKYAAFTEMKRSNRYTEKSIFELSRRHKDLKEMLTDYKLDTLDVSKSVLEIVSDYCNANDLAIKEYKPKGISTRENVQILSRYIVIEGGFKECLNLVYQLEMHEKAGRLASVNFKSYEDKKDGIVKLNCIIYVENII